MQIVGIPQSDHDGSCVETIDVWFSGRHRVWFVERLDSEGHQIGLAHRCVTEWEASACVEEWLRCHAETHLVSPRDMTMAEKRVLTDVSRRQDRAA